MGSNPIDHPKYGFTFIKIYSINIFMIRVNVISVEFLSDQWLIAEYRELPRCIKQNINIKNAPIKYCLGKGHMKWARCHIAFLLTRYIEICKEMQYRNFKVNYSPEDLINWTYSNVNRDLICGYIPSTIDLTINYQRLMEKYKLKPEFYHWTNRKKPESFKSI